MLSNFWNEMKIGSEEIMGKKISLRVKIAHVLFTSRARVHRIAPSTTICTTSKASTSRTICRSISCLRNLFNLLIQCPQLKLSVLEVTFQTIAKTVVEYANFSSKESRMVEKRISSAYRLSVLFT